MSGGSLETLRPQIEAAAFELIPRRGVSSGCSAKWDLRVSCYAKDFDAAKMIGTIADRIKEIPSARFLFAVIPAGVDAIMIVSPGIRLLTIRHYDPSIPEGIQIEDNERITILALMTDEEAQA